MFRGDRLGRGPWAVGRGPWAVGCGLWAVGCGAVGLWAVDCELWNFNPILLPSPVPRMEKKKEREGHPGNPESTGGLRIVIFLLTSN